MQARGLRNNNPLNIRHGKSQWEGMSERQRDKKFVEFTCRVYGYRAGFVLLRNYISKGCNTIGKIIARWAPSSDGNNTQSYIDFVSRTTRIHPSHVLEFEDRDALISIVQSMAQIESGIVEDKALIEEGYKMVAEKR